LSDQGLIVIAVVGLIAGWLAGKIVRGSGFGLVGDAAIGIVGALIGDWPLHRLGVHFSSGIIGLAINATIGAIVLLLALQVMGASGWGGRQWALAISCNFIDPTPVARESCFGPAISADDSATRARLDLSAPRESDGTSYFASTRGGNSNGDLAVFDERWDRRSRSLLAVPALPLGAHVVCRRSAREFGDVFLAGREDRRPPS
jgi:uncharacterized membrane protein YeaQ/YmgE (transglycosylase-associated protein family)